MKKIIPFSDNRIMRDVLGFGDRNIIWLEKSIGVKIFVKSQGLLIEGIKTKIERCAEIIDEIAELSQKGCLVTEEKLKDFIEPSEENAARESVKISVPSKKQFIIPKTAGQEYYIKAISENDIVFALGPAGTGKTYLAMAMAVNYLSHNKVRRIILTRPAIEAGESLGFLPGDMYQKLGPYLKPLYDAIYDMMEACVIEDYLETGVIEIAPLAYMRGRTLNNAFIILDEAQNCTSDQIKMFLTRLGFDSKTVITGDMTQSDLPGGKPSGLIEAEEILKVIKGINFINLTKKDVVRHPLVQQIIQAYEDYPRNKR